VTKNQEIIDSRLRGNAINESFLKFQQQEITMRRLLITLLMLSPAAFAGPDCTSADQSEWQDQDAFKQSLESDGYKIKKFKVTSGNCYEIYGWDKDGKKVEIYFNPVDGEIVKAKIED